MTESTSAYPPPEFDDEQARAVLGKRLLVGVTCRTRSDDVTRLEQFHGEILRASLEEDLILRVSGTGEERWLPPDLSRLEPAAPGRYTLKGSGEVVLAPDFLSTWTVYPPAEPGDEPASP